MCVAILLVIIVRVGYHISTNEIPYEIIRTIPPKYWLNIELIDSEKGIPYRHYHETLIYSADISNDIMTECLKSQQWHEMPLSPDEYEYYIDGFFDINVYGYGKYLLEDQDTSGYWRFDGEDDKGIIMLYLCDIKEIIYMYID